MKRYFASLLIICALCFGYSPLALANDDPAQSISAPEKPKKKRAKMLTGTPVHTAVAGGGSLPKGVLLTVYNFSLADKTNAKRGYKGSDIYNQTHLLKLRYGLTNHWEIHSTGGYVNNGFRDPTPSNRANHTEGILDQSLGLTYAPLQLHQGDPIAVSFSGAINFPTGFYGRNHLPGGGAWGGRFCTGFATFFTDDIRFDVEGSVTASFENGNQGARKGTQYQWNTMVRYLFDWFDIGIESVYTHTEDGTGYKPGRDGRVNLHNGGADWYIGPNTSIAIDALDMWVGAGVYFPVMQDVNSAAAVDDVQFHFKVAKMW